jgi:predicted phosphoribosyltransferase
MAFQDRAEAGRMLATRLLDHAHDPNVVVLALPRGGVPVAYEVAQMLGAPLDVFVVRKLGVPNNEELAMGAIASGGVMVLNDEVMRGLAISHTEFEEIRARQQLELERREHAYRGGRPALRVRGRTVILIDDGIATGSSIRAALLALRRLGTARIVVAVPVAPQRTVHELRTDGQEVVCYLMPALFNAIGLWYEDFSPVSDEEVRALLRVAAEESPTSSGQLVEAGAR